MTAEEELKSEAIKWLEKGRSNNVIADKIVEAVKMTYDLTVEEHQMRLKEQLFKAICKPIYRRKKAWWELW